MEKDLFKNIGKKISSHESLVEFDVEWRGIQQKQAKSKRKTILFWLSTCALLLCLIFAFIFFNGNESRVNNLDQSKEVVVSNKIITNQKALGEIEAKIEETDCEKFSGVINTKSRKAVVVGQEENQKQRRLILGDSRNINSQVELSTNSDHSDSKINFAQSESEFLAIKQNPKETSQVKAIVSLKRMSRLKMRPLRTNLFEIGDPLLPALGSDDLLVLDIPKVSPNTKRLDIFFRGGIGITDQRFSPKTSITQSYADLREKNEKAVETYAYDLGLNLHLSNRSFISLSGNYSFAFDKTVHKQSLPKSFELEDVLLKRKIYPNGDIDSVYGDTTVLGMQLTTTTHYVRYTSLNLNSAYGYYLVDSPKYSLSVLGGLSYNLALSAEGMVRNPFDIEGQFVEVNQSYKKKYGLGLLGGFSLDYHLGNRLKLNIHPSFNYSLMTSTNENYLLDSKFSSYSLKLGVKYSLK